MRAAHAIEPTLSWPGDNYRKPVRVRSAETVQPFPSAKEVAAASPPLARVAALLVSISQNNTYEGRDPQIVPDGLSSGFVADLLGVEIGTLAAMLVELRNRGLIETADASGLR